MFVLLAEYAPQKVTAVGLAVGANVGITDGWPVVGNAVGIALGAGVIVKVGVAVGRLVTTLTPAAPTMAARPLQVVVPEHPSRIMYVCVGVPAGIVY